MDMSPLRAPRPVGWLAEAALYARSSLAITQADSQCPAGGVASSGEPPEARDDRYVLNYFASFTMSIGFIHQDFTG